MFFIMISYLFIVLSYIMGEIQNIQLHHMLEISLYIGFLLLVLYYIKEKKEFFPNKELRNIFLGMVFIFVVYQLLNINEFYINVTIKECIINLLVLINIYMFSGYIFYEKCENKFILITYVILSIFICIIYVYNFDRFQGLKQISMIFNSQDRYRNSYGLLHPNVTGLICYVDLLLSFFLYNCLLHKKFVIRILILSLDTIVSIVLISTASRTAVTSLILFFIVFYTLKIRKSIKINIYISIVIKIFAISTITIFIVKGILYITNIGILEFLSETNRIDNFTINIPILYSNNKQLFGMGNYEAYYNMYGGTPYLDNWYLYMFLTTGIIGLILSLFLILKVYFALVKNSNNSLLKTFTISYFVSQLYYSLFETQFFTANVLNTFIFWIFVFTTIYYKNKKT